MHQVLQYCTSVVRILLQVENLVLICLSTGWRLEDGMEIRGSS